MNILGIETSCDETGIAIYNTEKQSIISEQLFSQASKHAEYGGVVPELASRDHLIKIIPLIRLTLEEAKLEFSDLNGIAYTAGPGLRGPLLIGASMAKSLAFSLKIPSIGIHHMEAHLLINLLEDPAPKFPFLTLLISGGHCLLINAKNLGSYEIVGQTIDDAVGEAFDKAAKFLGLGYPGGPALEKISKKGSNVRFNFPRPLLKSHDCNFSFSGLKTSLIREVKEIEPLTENDLADIASSYQQAIIDCLREKSSRAISIAKEEYKDLNINYLGDK